VLVALAFAPIVVWWLLYAGQVVHTMRAMCNWGARAEPILYFERSERSSEGWTGAANCLRNLRIYVVTVCVSVTPPLLVALLLPALQAARTAAATSAGRSLPEVQPQPGTLGWWVMLLVLVACCLWTALYVPMGLGVSAIEQRHSPLRVTVWICKCWPQLTFGLFGVSLIMSVLIAVLGFLLAVFLSLILLIGGESWEGLFALARGGLPDARGQSASGILRFAILALAPSVFMLVSAVPIWVLHWVNLTLSLVIGRIYRRRETQSTLAIEVLGALLVLSPLVAGLAGALWMKQGSPPIDTPTSVTSSPDGQSVPAIPEGKALPPASKHQVPRIEKAPQSGRQEERPEHGPKSPQKPAFRVWSDSSAKFSTEAELVEFREGKVRLKKRDGREITVPIEQLSAADQEHLRTSLRIPPSSTAPPVQTAETEFIDAARRFRCRVPRECIVQQKESGERSRVQFGLHGATIVVIVRKTDRQPFRAEDVDSVAEQIVAVTRERAGARMTIEQRSVAKLHGYAAVHVVASLGDKGYSLRMRGVKCVHRGMDHAITLTALAAEFSKANAWMDAFLQTYEPGPLKPAEKADAASTPAKAEESRE